MLIAILSGGLLVFAFFSTDGVPRIDELRERVDEHVAEMARRKAALESLDALEEALEPLVAEREKTRKRLKEILEDPGVTRGEIEALADQLDDVETRIQDQLIESRNALKQSVRSEEWPLLFRRE